MVVNLIPYNPTYAPGSEEFQEPTEEALQTFKSIVHAHGLLVTIRRQEALVCCGVCAFCWRLFVWLRFVFICCSVMV